MIKFFSSKIFVGFTCFTLGILANHYYTKMHFSSEVLSDSERSERIPVTPDDFNHDKMMEAFQNMEKSIQDMHQSFDRDLAREMRISGIEKKEDEKFVYFNIPLNSAEKNHELKVSVKDGMISIQENTPNSESKREFSIDPGLDETKADVQILNEKILIKVPKKK